MRCWALRNTALGLLFMWFEGNIRYEVENVSLFFSKGILLWMKFVGDRRPTYYNLQ